MWLFFENNTNNVINYLTHHGVVNINKLGKVRVVFDAGATYNSKSLNKSLLEGLDLLNNLVGKSKSIPQPELQAALTTSRLKQKITKELKIPTKLQTKLVDIKLSSSYP